MLMRAVEVKDLYVIINNEKVLDSINLEVRDEILGLIGPNGAGKTTLFKAILGLQSYKGKVRIFEYDERYRDYLLPLIGYVPQSISIEQNFPASVIDILSISAQDKRLLKGIELLKARGVIRNLRSKEERIKDALSITNLEGIKHKRVHALSGGELQRLLIAKALVNDPLLLILDEPTSNLDVNAQVNLVNMLKMLKEEYNMSIMISSHDLDLINKVADKVACMNGRLFFHVSKDEFFRDERLLRLYSEYSMQLHMKMHGDKYD